MEINAAESVRIEPNSHFCCPTNAYIAMSRSIEELLLEKLQSIIAELTALKGDVKSNAARTEHICGSQAPHSVDLDFPSGLNSSAAEAVDWENCSFERMLELP
ncbi:MULTISPECIES: hypothetical protein [unclassified Caballeronia]|uniref:hypothetical protein n=1 Tax=unclassified Caballeronia TaxID=2646786 RepID=UPI002027DE3F|nr:MULTISPECIES: hypothetical protein [unclassified Caballeronia]